MKGKMEEGEGKERKELGREGEPQEPPPLPPPPPTPRLEPTPAGNVGVERDAKERTVLQVRLVESRLTLAQEALVSYEKRKEKEEDRCLKGEQEELD